METTVPFELEALSHGVRYQQWIADSARPFLGRRILEVGAGIGNLSKHLPVRDLLVLSEADEKLLPRLEKTALEAFPHNGRVFVKKMDLAKSLLEQTGEDHFDTIVSFNVLEHIENDGRAFADMVNVLRSSRAEGEKRIVTLVPAHDWARGTIDKSFGHYRRYNRKKILSLLETAGLDAKICLEEFRHFNLVGLPGWFAMNRVLKKENFSLKTVKKFEAICPVVRPVDDFLHKILGVPFGQSILFVVRVMQ